MGQIGLILIIFAETGLLIGFFLPGDSLLFTAGILATQGNLNLAAILIGCFLAAVIGDQVGYTIGQKRAGACSSARTHASSSRSTSSAPRSSSNSTGRRRSCSPASYRSCARSPRSSPASARCRGRTFTSYNVVGGFIWAVGVTLAGYLLGRCIGDPSTSTCCRSSASIIVLSIMPPIIEWRKAKKQQPVHFTQAQAEAEAAALHEVVEED